MSEIRRDRMEPGFNAGLIEADKLAGGVFVKKTKVLRNAIGKGFRVYDTARTTLCFVLADNTMYALISNPDTEITSDTDWTPVLTIASGLKPLGTWNISNADPKLADEDAVDQGGNFYFVTGAASPTLINIPGLFADQSVTVKDGDLVVSNGTIWFINATNLSWDTINKPQVITDYVNGIVIAHTHVIADVTGLPEALDLKFDEGDVAPLDEDYDSISDSLLIDFGFLKEYFYPKSQTYTRDEIDGFFDFIDNYYTKTEINNLFVSQESDLHDWTYENFYDKQNVEDLIAATLDGVDGVIIGETTQAGRDVLIGGSIINGYTLTAGQRMIVTDGYRYVDKFTGSPGDIGSSFWIRLYLYDCGCCDDSYPNFTDVNTSESFIVLDFVNHSAGDFDGSDSIDGDRIWGLLNGASAQEFSFRFEMMDIYNQILPDLFKIWNVEFDNNTHIWRPSESGLYEFLGRKRINGDWIVKIFGPHR